MNDINNLFQENIKLKESQGVPVESTFDARKRISQNLYLTQKTLGVDNPLLLKEIQQQKDTTPSNTMLSGTIGGPENFMKTQNYNSRGTTYRDYEASSLDSSHNMSDDLYGNESHSPMRI